MVSGSKTVIWDRSHPVLTADNSNLNDGDALHKRPIFSPFFCKKCGIVFTGILGVIFLITGLKSSEIIDSIISGEIQDKARLDDPNSDVFKTWANPQGNGVEIYMNVVVYDIRNPNEVLSGAKPDIRPVGPFVFKERRLKHSFVYSNDGSILWYKENKTYHALDKRCPEGTDPFNFTLGCSLDISTQITSFNLPLLTTVMLLRPLGRAESTVIDLLNRSIADPGLETIIINRPASDIIFGYYDQFLAKVEDLLSNSTSNSSIPNFSLLTNNSLSSATNWSAVKTRSSEGQYGDLVAWEGNNGSVPFWSGCNEKDNNGRLWNYEANLLVGTEGLFFQPGVKKTTDLNAFVGDIGRSGSLVFSNVQKYDDLITYRFVLNRQDFMNVDEFSQNCAYSNFGLSGTLNMTDFVGAPAFASKPFFLDADPAYLTNVTGLKPMTEEEIRARFDTSLDIEPYSGVVINANKQLQINMQVVPSKFVESASKLHYSYTPILYSGETAVIPSNVTDTLKSSIVAAVAAGNIYYYGGSALGGLLLLIAIIQGFRLHQMMAIIDMDDYDVQDTERSPLLVDTRTASLIKDVQANHDATADEQSRINRGDASLTPSLRAAGRI